jgi:hypothetical protein
MAIKILNANAWKNASPKGVLVGTTWKTPTKISVLENGVWKQVWPDAAPPYLYDVQITQTPDYSADFTALDGWPPGDVNEAYFFKCTTITGLDGYVGRNFSRRFGLSGYSSFACSLRDMSGIPGKTLQTISFNVTVRP